MAFLLFYYYSGLLSLKNNSNDKINLVKSGRNTKDAVLLKIPIAVIEDPFVFSRINNTEFVYQGNLYDIISEICKQDTLFILCLHDKKEEDFHERVASVSGVNGGKQKTYCTFRTGITLSLKSLIPKNTVLYSAILKVIYFNNELDLANQIYADVPSPPPRTCQ